MILLHHHPCRQPCHHLPLHRQQLTTTNKSSSLYLRTYSNIQCTHLVFCACFLKLDCFAKRRTLTKLVVKSLKWRTFSKSNDFTCFPSFTISHSTGVMSVPEVTCMLFAAEVGYLFVSLSSSKIWTSMAALTALCFLSSSAFVFLSSSSSRRFRCRSRRRSLRPLPARCPV